MSNISELANVPQISFIENMTLQETEEQLKAEYARIYREQTGKELVLGEADAKTLLLKAFARPRNAFCWQRHEPTPWQCPPVRG